MASSADTRVRRQQTCGIAVLLGLAAGCGGRELIPTPNLFVRSAEDPFAAVPEPFRTNRVDVLYLTDRTRVETDDGSVKYDHGRSESLAFGSATVTFGDDVSWEALVAASRTDDREISLGLSVSSVEEKSRFPETPFPLIEDKSWPEEDLGVYGHGLTQDPATIARHAETAEALRRDLRARLALTPVKEAYVFVHGYNNTFDDAVSVIAEIWHFLGRRGVPIAYTWPAGMGGLRGYFYDRESGVFTIFHLKEFLRALQGCDELDKVHFIAHSLGTDVTLTALRELWIEMRESMRPSEEKRKLGHIILAAPDLDLDLVKQRLGAEQFMNAVRHVTVYMSTSDVALGLSTWLWVSRNRIGRVAEEDLQEDERQKGSLLRNLSLIDSRVDTGWIGHNYFYSHPAVLSDLVLILRDSRRPGEEHGRPLAREPGSVFWSIDDDYPRSGSE
jgi:esterase/lipase superfamily enzyme